MIKLLSYNNVDMDDAFAFYVILWYEIIIQYCCICIQLDEI